MRNENTSTAKSVFYYFLTFIVVMATASFIVAPLYKLFTGTDGGADVMILTSTIYSVVLFILFYRLGWCPITKDYLRGNHWAVLGWTVLFSLGMIIPAMFAQEHLPAMKDIAAEQLSELLKSDFGFVTLCIFAPFVEEMVFRGAILRKLLTTANRPWIAIVVSALLFALVHLNPAQMPYAFVAGIFLGWLYWRTGSIAPGVVYHCVSNSVVFFASRLLPVLNEDDGLLQLFGGDSRRETLAVIFSMFIVLPSLYQLVIRTRKRREPRV